MAKSIPYPREHYEAALASESKDRAYAFLQIREEICGIECEPLTPRRVEWLRLCKSPYIIGGHVSLAEIVQFLWVVSADFKASKDARDDFFKRIVPILDIEKARADIADYLDRAYLDSSHRSSKSAPSVSTAAYFAMAMAGEPYRMNLREVMDTPIPVIFQLIKAREIHEGGVVANRRSDKVRGDWLQKQQTLETRRMKRQRRKENGG